jgi:hypothetical protein
MWMEETTQTPALKLDVRQVREVPAVVKAVREVRVATHLLK